MCATFCAFYYISRGSKNLGIPKVYKSCIPQIGFPAVMRGCRPALRSLRVDPRVPFRVALEMSSALFTVLVRWRLAKHVPRMYVAAISGTWFVRHSSSSSVLERYGAARELQHCLGGRGLTGLLGGRPRPLFCFCLFGIFRCFWNF